jgi:VWFA-related protein
VLPESIQPDTTTTVDSKDRWDCARLAIACAALAVARAGLSAQTPVFLAANATVRVDVVVTDSRGRPVTGLTAGDFVVEDSGRRQQITAFAAAADQSIDFASAQADVATNTQSMSRAVAVVIDDGTIGPEYIVPTKRLLNDLVARLPVTDLISLTYVRFANMGEPLTTDRDRVRNGIDRLSAALGFRGNLRDTGRVLARAVQTVRAQGCARCLVVYVSAGFAGPVMDFGFAQAEGVPIYSLDPRGVDDPLSAGGIGSKTSVLGGLGLLRGQHEFMRTLAENTGGLAFVGAADMPAALDTIVSENRSFYLLGFTPDPTHADDHFHPINVIVRRDGVKVRARLGYYADLRHKSAVADFKSNMSSTRIVNDIPLRATALRTALGEKTGTVSVVVEGDEPEPPAEWQLTYRAIVDTDGRGKSGSVAVRPIRSDAGWSVFASLELPIEATVVRLGVFNDKTQQSGIIEIPLERVTDPARSTPEPRPRLLGLALVEGPVARPDSIMRISARRNFSSKDSALVVATVGPTSVALSRPPTMIIKGAETSQGLVVQANKQASGVAYFSAQLPLQTLPSGTYSVEVTFRDDTDATYRKRVLFVIGVPRI